MPSTHTENATPLHVRGNPQADRNARRRELMGLSLSSDGREDGVFVAWMAGEGRIPHEAACFGRNYLKFRTTADIRRMREELLKQTAAYAERRGPKPSPDGYYAMSASIGKRLILDASRSLAGSGATALDQRSGLLESDVNWPEQTLGSPKDSYRKRRRL
jgi:hypothetical protein